ncbi:LmbE family N-acetylglucosaminyl deacetylase [Luteibacter rhizovicinus]|uniref:LmbE family N-acetylglucosaminyl deacetylase n=1 Tax=Luteibacter rhizovicinus TaxID=242606 RepID=A0A4R3YZQ9_9GAMM|nr:PIG-L family deacetylase [Luteibacter rhizovicinus]TCV97408.1 LmbE family N-acetylglucosaminyl deacetylase [Luteibacter rhizovicinus]
MTTGFVLDASTRLLVVSPHPDDESLATGGLIQRVLAAGGRVDVLLLTDGDDNPWPQRWLERRIVIDNEARKRWGTRRRGEVASALARLGVAADRLHALGWHDMAVTTELRRRHGKAIETIGAVLNSVSPTLVVMPALGDRHPDHSAAHVLSRLALARSGLPAEVLTYLVHGKKTEADKIALPVDPAIQAVKREAVLAHGTQVALSRGRMLGIADRPECFGGIAAAGTERRLALPWRPAPWLQKRLRLVAADDRGVMDMAWNDAPLEREGQDWVLLLRDAPGPSFVKMTADLDTLWIFDRWGWVAA